MQYHPLRPPPPVCCHFICLGCWCWSTSLISSATKTRAETRIQCSVLFYWHSDTVNLLNVVLLIYLLIYSLFAKLYNQVWMNMCKLSIIYKLNTPDENNWIRALLYQTCVRVFQRHLNKTTAQQSKLRGVKKNMFTHTHPLSSCLEKTWWQ